MKKLFYSAVVITALLMSSCTPDNPTTTNNQTTTICPQPSLQFKGNGNLYVCNAVSDSRVGWAGYPYLRKILNGSSGFNFSLNFGNIKDYNDNFQWMSNFPITQYSVLGWITFPLNNTLIAADTYNHNDNVIEFSTQNYRYEGGFGDISLIITNINNGLASGTFSGSLPGGTGTVNYGPQMNITDGVFSNVPVFE